MHKDAVRWVSLLMVLCLFGVGCRRSSSPDADPNADSPDTVRVVFTYGSEKEAWVTDVTDAFNSSRQTVASGKRIYVEAVPMGSGECIDEILTGRRKPHIVSPASAAFITLGNAQSRTTLGRDVVGPTQNLVLSPVVIAMWRPMAEAIGWGTKPVGWTEVLALARDPNGWASHGHPEWGSFKFGHTHPEFSNSGLISVIAEAYAGTKKVAGLTLDDLQGPQVASFVGDIEASVVHYGSSTGFFGTKMFQNGPQYLSAAVLYENMVIDSYAPGKSPALPVVAIYPREGTFWSDHPIGIVDGDWVTPEHREAAEQYIRYLLDRPQQERAMTFGFRPANPDVGLSAPIDTAHGVDPQEPKTTLEVPSADVINALIKLWHANKRHTHAVLVLDTSGSMKEDQRLDNAKLGAIQFLRQLDPEDTVSLLPFNSRSAWAGQDLEMSRDRDRAIASIQGLFPAGGTALYDSIDEGFRFLLDRNVRDRITAVVVLTDGEDRDSRLRLEALLSNIRSDNERRAIRVFTIGYGSEANATVLKRIADATQAKFYEGTPQNIESVFKEISTFF